MLTAGNGINQNCPLESLEAFFDEALVYGTRIVQDSNPSSCATKDTK
jgi:hypothetical protein